ncbi:STAS domain-containing protein [Williamsia soli]|uniref:STAS domain-containing protein n=1 Tax=Williamsia soli TaxID=364929 RepID=UPI001A9DBA7D|nr:STAS domain-containing protein [Williamsia soli]
MAPNKRKPSSVTDVTDAADLTGDGLTIATVGHGDISVLTVWGSIDLLTVPQLTKSVEDAVSAQPAGLIIDLTYTDFLSSVGMSALVQAQETIGTDRRFAVVADGPSTARPIKLVGLDRTLALYATMDSALADMTAAERPEHEGRATA